MCRIYRVGVCMIGVISNKVCYLIVMKGMIDVNIFVFVLEEGGGGV